MKNLKNQNGITLIALIIIITIIVLLILAGVTIGSRIISFNAEEEQPPEINIKETITQGDKTAVIPKGYVVSSVEGENSIEEGLVIYEGEEEVTEENHEEALTKRDQYVWIPVPDINSMSMCKSNREGSVCNLKLQTDGTLKCEVHAGTATEIVGRLYTDETSSSTTEKNASGADVTIYSEIINFNQTNQRYYANYREPAVVTGNSTGNGTEYDGATNISYGPLWSKANTYHWYETASAFLEVLEEEYIKMATSVAKNGGFYVSRYEMGDYSRINNKKK